MHIERPTGIHWLGERLNATGCASDERGCVLYFETKEQCKAFMQAMTWFGERVRKKSGSSWPGDVSGFYSASRTPIGLCVESERELGSVQIYPEAALERVPDGE